MKFISFLAFAIGTCILMYVSYNSIHLTQGELWVAYWKEMLAGITLVFTGTAIIK